MKKLTEALTHPVTLLNGTLVGTLIVIQSLHLHAHYQMEMDVDGYVKQYCNNNPTKCEWV